MVAILSGLPWARAEILVSERFDYPDGPIVETGAATWRTLLGTHAQIRVADNALRLQEREFEIIESPLPAGPRDQGNIYAGFTIRASAQPSGDGGYIAGFSMATTSDPRVLGRIYLTRGAAPETFRIGISEGLSFPTGTNQTDLALGTPYRLVVRHDLENNHSKLWVNPTSEDSVGLAPTESTFPGSFVGMAFRQRLLDGNGMGTVTVDDLVVATTFDEAKSPPNPPPHPLPSEPQLLGSWPGYPRGYAGNIAATNGRAYVLLDSYQIQALDVQDPAAPKRLGYFVSRSVISDLAIVGNFIYAPSPDGGLTVLDFSDATKPRRVGTFAEDSFTGIVVAGNHAYLLAPLSNSLAIMDIGDPTKPRLVKSLRLAGVPYAIAIEGHLAYVLVEEKGMAVVDISNPSAPRIIATPALPADITRSFNRLTMIGTYAYIFTQTFSENNALVVLDVRDPSRPETLARVPGASGAAVRSGDRLYVTASQPMTDYWQHRLQVFDVSNPAQPRRLWEQPEGTGSFNTLALLGNHLLVSDENFGVRILDVTESERPSTISELPMYGGLNGVAVSGNLAYLADQAGFAILDVAEPSNPRLLGKIAEMSCASTPIISGDHAFVTTGFPSKNGIRVVNIRNPMDPVDVASIPIEPAPNSISNLILLGHRLCFRYQDPSDYSHRLSFVDVSAPTSPKVVGSFLLGRQFSYPRFAGSGDHVYVIGESGSGMITIDAKDPSKPRQVGHYRDGLFATSSISVEGSHAYMVGYQENGTLLILDLSNPAQPLKVSDLTNVAGDGNSLGSLTVRGGYAYCLFSVRLDGQFYSKTQLIDVRDPRQPKKVGIPISDFSTRSTFAGERIYEPAGQLRIWSNPWVFNFAPRPRREAGGYRLTVQGPPERTFQIQRSSDLVNWRNWTNGAFGTPAATQEFLDTESPDGPGHFYRILAP